MLLPEYYEKCSFNKTFKIKTKNLTTIPDLRLALGTCDEVKLVRWDHKPPKQVVRKQFKENKRNRRPMTYLKDKFTNVYKI